MPPFFYGVIMFDGDKQAATRRHYTITKKQLPLSCPLPDQRVWDAHPRVYLPIEEKGGHSVCPYCNAEYKLIP